MILDFSSYNLVVYFYIFILKSTRNLLRSKKIPFQEDQTNPSRIINPNNRTPPFHNRSRACSNGPRKRFRGKKKKKKCVTKSKRIIKIRSVAVESVWGVQRCAEVHFGNHWHEGTQTWPCPAEWSITPSLRSQRVILYNRNVFRNVGTYCMCKRQREDEKYWEEGEEKLTKKGD